VVTVKAGQPSVTARRVAAQRLAFPRVPAEGGNAAADELLAADVAGELAGAPPGPMAPYLAARKSFFDRVVVTALAAGVGQVVVVGAGYDGRALRYARPGVRWFEVDHPDTQADKQQRLRDLGIETGHVAFVPVDLTATDVGPALLAAGFDRARESLVLCEGVLVYLDRAVIDRLLAGLRAVAAPGSRLALSVSVAAGDAGARERREQFARRVAAVGEPARTVLQPAEAEGLLHRAGWSPDAAGPLVSDRGRAAGLLVATARPTL
jgi:methyltransferase (TIGR00027 family)